MTHSDDLRLAHRLARGDDKAFDGLFEEYFSRLFRFVMRRTGRDAETARDVVQAALIKGLRHIRSYRGEASLYTWLCQIARNELGDQRRRQMARDQTLAALENDPSVRASLESMQWVSLADPENAIEESQYRDLVHTALDHLPARYAQALELKYVEDLSVEQIAERMDVTAIAIQSLLARARLAFKEAYDTLIEGLEDLRPEKPSPRSHS